jgi:tRNA pseudouridine55 synthase
VTADGLLVVDKPAGWTSHDVVARARRLVGTRRVGHAGTLDPMATGVLVLGIGRATRLLGHLTLTEKAYDATIRLGQATVTDDAEGDVTATASTAEVTDAAVLAGVAALTGQLLQVPSSVSAIKVDGQRAYKRVRAGDDVELAARPVTVSVFDVRGIRRPTDPGDPDGAGVVDVDVSVVCSSGTYVRALARDLGGALGVGGHLTALRRTRVGPYALDAARTLDQLGDLAALEVPQVATAVLPIADAARAAFPVREVDAAEAAVVAHGGPLSASDRGPGPVAVIGPDGTFLALVEDRDGRAKPTAVFV